MNRSIKSLLATLALVAPLATFAAPRLTPSGDDQFKNISPGESQQQVREALGKPNFTHMKDGLAHWFYTFTDSWGDITTFEVAFNASGQVADASDLMVSP